jgi:hypothetical protein
MAGRPPEVHAGAVPAPDAPDDLAATLARLFVRYDPLEPWLTESHYDETYWDREALRLARRLRAGMQISEVRNALLAVLAESFPGACVGGGSLREDHVDQLTSACWQLVTAAATPTGGEQQRGDRPAPPPDQAWTLASSG